jgi:hypothetical protein
VSALSWDEQLAAQAAAYVADCPKTNSAARGVGENMAWWVQLLKVVSMPDIGLVVQIVHTWFCRTC